MIYAAYFILIFYFSFALLPLVWAEQSYSTTTNETETTDNPLILTNFTSISATINATLIQNIHVVSAPQQIVVLQQTLTQSTGDLSQLTFNQSAIAVTKLQQIPVEANEAAKRMPQETTTAMMQNSQTQYLVPNYPWREVTYNTAVKRKADILRGTRAGVITKGKPVYVSLTTMDSRINQVDKTIMQILKGSVVPDRIYLFISLEKFILDNGIPEKNLPKSLLEITKLYPVSIVYTKNMGPHRKLLPLLAKKWQEDCIIITIDDESKPGLEDYVRQLLKYWVAGKQANIVALKVRRIGFCDKHPWHARHYHAWGEINYGVREMMVLPTGTGGVLYQPKFMHPIVFDERLRELTSKADDLMFRLCSMINRVGIVAGCRDEHSLSHGKVKVQARCPYYASVTSKVPWDLSSSAYYSFKPANHPPTPAPTAKPNSGESKKSKSQSKRYKPSQHHKSSSISNATKSVTARRSLSVSNSTKSVAASDTRRLTGDGHLDIADSKSLYMRFNKFDGNDKAWSSATRYLSERGLLDMSDMAAMFINREREGCVGGGKRRSHSCMLYRC